MPESFLGLLPLRVTPTWRAGSVDGVGAMPTLPRGSLSEIGPPCCLAFCRRIFGIVLPTICPCDESSCVMQSIVIAIASNEHPMAVCHRKEAKRGQPCGQRGTRTC